MQVWFELNGGGYGTLGGGGVDGVLRGGGDSLKSQGGVGRVFCGKLESGGNLRPA